MTIKPGNVHRRGFLNRMAGGLTAAAGTAMIADMLGTRAYASAVDGKGVSKLRKGAYGMRSSEAPVSIGRVALIVNNLDTVGTFYQQVLGLEELARDGETLKLGAGNNVLLELRQDRAARRYPHAAGLFHTAFLMPDRDYLGRWLIYAAQNRIPLTGAADHDVSEALYLNDPEGNGIEIYADRPVETWQMDGEYIRMGSHHLDLEAIAGAARQDWSGAPENMVVGHVHLQVGDINAVDEFMTRHLAQDRMLHEGSAGFYSSGGYHHHFAGNIWNSNGAKARPTDSSGLDEIVLLTDGTVLQPQELTDPWGTRFTVERK